MPRSKAGDVPSPGRVQSSTGAWKFRVRKALATLALVAAVVLSLPLLAVLALIVRFGFLLVLPVLVVAILIQPRWAGFKASGEGDGEEEWWSP